MDTVLYNRRQKELISKLELAVAHLIFEQEHKLAKALSIIVEYLYKKEPSIAVLEAQSMGLDERTILVLKQVFNVKY